MKFKVPAVTLAFLAVAASMHAARASNLSASPQPTDTILYDQSDLVIGTQANKATLNLDCFRRIDRNAAHANLVLRGLFDVIDKDYLNGFLRRL